VSILSIGIKEYCLINHETGCQYMFKDQNANLVVVLILTVQGWRTYDSARVGGNYETPLARTFWNSLIKQGFTTNYET
jgi:hypothetical protein